MEYMSIKQAAEKWKVSERLVQRYCTDGRLEGATKFGGAWQIPANTEKPGDPRKAADRPKKQAAKGKPQAKDNKPPRVAMPLLNTAFVPGHCMESIVQMEDPDTRNIALAEYYYFSGRAEKASELAEPYLEHEDFALKLSACFIYTYANLALNRIPKSRQAMGILQTTVTAMSDNTSAEDRAIATCVSAGVSVLLHLPLPKVLAPLKDYIHMMPPGFRLFVLYIQAHHSYLNGQYGAAIGIAETALALESETYPIPTIYLHLVASMGYINLRRPEEAKTHLMEAWKIAQPGDLIEAFGEHHGLLGGVLEATLKKAYPDDFRRIINITYKFSAGWRKIHNPDTGHDVADDLTTTEFAASMLASRGWTNQEIADHMGISENTVRHYVSTALQKLGIEQRTDLQQFMLK